ncbi:MULTISPECIES: hypothetical protein [unclassified Luteimonas]
MRVRESTIEQELIEKLGELKYTLRPDIRDRAALERNFREKFEALNPVDPVHYSSIDRGCPAMVARDQVL